jgi:hypothetical protein
MYAKLRQSLGPGWTAGIGVILCGCALSAGVRAPASDSPGSDPVAGLDRRMECFLASFDSISAAGFVEFFPRTGDVVYRHTRHTPGGDEVTVSRFRAEEIPAALRSSGPLWASFQFQFEGQPIGLLTHQVMVRTGRWRRVGESRFVPPDADPLSPAYVEWRSEGPNWVISQLGDESFVDVPLPPWMTN